MLWQVTQNLPPREDYAEMLGRARATTPKALEETSRRSGNLAALLLYQMQLAEWDRLIERIAEELDRLEIE